eukprot:TRINITY_DN11260_c0_g1_i1.p1 TRINITY_DN11260_c0_g1~~TRINITY_DN11260_c0_g1_i1.p1  ORF type:complete len:411 (+),score=76.90 TRINITY_DN11260_c0_g1_i1:67-1299(+)
MFKRNGKMLIDMSLVDKRYPLLKKWSSPVEERIAMHPRIDEPIVAEFSKGTFTMCNERYPSVERLADQYFPGFLPRTKEDYELLNEKTENMTTEELMLEQIGLWNITMLLREYSAAYYTGSKLSTPMQWEVAGIDHLLPKYYTAWRKVVTYFTRRVYSYYTGELIVASPKYKVGGVVPQIMHVTEIAYRKLVLIYPVCHNDFDVYPDVGETRYAEQPLDFLLYSHLNYYHVVLNIYKAIMVQEGWCEPDDIVSMALVNLSLDPSGEVEPRIYIIETDDRIREALEKRFAGVGPAADTISREWFERKDLWKEQEKEMELDKEARGKAVNEQATRAGFDTWKKDVKFKEDVFTEYLKQQQRELEEDKQSKIWQMKNWVWQKLGGQGPLTRDALELQRSNAYPGGPFRRGPQE